MVILTQENGLLANYGLLLRPSGARIGLWGHGQNFQSRGKISDQLAQRWKANWSRRADWWFAYSGHSARVVQGFGYPAARITVLDNTIDTRALRAAVDAARQLGRDVARRRFGLEIQGPLGVFVGSLYANKLLGLLIDSAEIVHRSLPNFQLAIVGDGPLRAWLAQRTSGLRWVHLLGALGGEDKAALLSSADCFLNPGATGLSILDAFASELPYLTTNGALHGPEIAYLEAGVNGLITRQESAEFAEAAVRVLLDRDLADELAQGSRRSCLRYGLEAMTDRFVRGVEAWSASPPLRTIGA
jgi:glycosyltransferase involved in cell wall biosynthesis